MELGVGHKLPFGFVPAAQTLRHPPGILASFRNGSRENHAPKMYLSRKAFRNFPRGSYCAATFLKAGSRT